jgi:hypothetical protein
MSTVPAGTREYCRTFSATTKHVVNPANRDKTLCGARVSTYCAGILRHQRDFHYGLETCAKCEAGAAKRGLVEGPEVYRPYQPRVIRYNARFNGLACIEDVDMVDEKRDGTATLCGVGANLSKRLDGPQGRKVCPDCQARAEGDGYYHEEEVDARIARQNTACSEARTADLDPALVDGPDGDAPVAWLVQLDVEAHRSGWDENVQGNLWFKPYGHLRNLIDAAYAVGATAHRSRKTSVRVDIPIAVTADRPDPDGGDALFQAHVMLWGILKAANLAGKAAAIGSSIQAVPARRVRAQQEGDFLAALGLPTRFVPARDFR